MKSTYNVIHCKLLISRNICVRSKIHCFPITGKKFHFFFCKSDLLKFNFIISKHINQYFDQTQILFCGIKWRQSYVYYHHFILWLRNCDIVIGYIVINNLKTVVLLYTIERLKKIQCSTDLFSSSLHVLPLYSHLRVCIFVFWFVFLSLYWWVGS